MTTIPGLPATEGIATLVPYGRVSWPEITQMLAGSQAAWADYSGFHVGPPPQSPPPAWTTGWLARVRVDVDAAIVGVLALTAGPASPPSEQWRELVGFRRLRSQTWDRAEKRVGQLLPEVAAQPADLYQVVGEYPVTFVRIPQPDSAG